MDEVLPLAKKHLEECFCVVGIQERFGESLLLAGEIGMQKLCYERRNMLRPGDHVRCQRQRPRPGHEPEQRGPGNLRFRVRPVRGRVEAAGPVFAAWLREFRFLNDKYQKICAALGGRLAGEAAVPTLKPKA
ncbi:hypothetical protein [uncultured Desulfovibrio sp.]|mgnify:CR=1 FL=1|uniref:hypothetical protein n=1 Tax=uncultured Desulfovibrio sp. TaxID=167968 RepID=UPI002616E304|nr:hypothetical protein [uncultured Desulfovibrio sp.]